MGKATLAGILVSVVFVSTAMARNLGDVVQQVGAGWLAGTWESQDDAGGKTTSVYTWALDKNAVVVELHSAQVNSKGMLLFNASEDKVIYVAADNRGGTSQGTGAIIDGFPVIVYEYTFANGQKLRTGVLHRRVDDNTFRGEVYEGLSSGTLAVSPRRTLLFKRKVSDQSSRN